MNNKNENRPDWELDEKTARLVKEALSTPQIPKEKADDMLKNILKKLNVSTTSDKAWSPKPEKQDIKSNKDAVLSR